MVEKNKDSISREVSIVRKQPSKMPFPPSLLLCDHLCAEGCRNRW